MIYFGLPKGGINMKKLMLTALFSMGLAANACVDFTGSYVFGEGTGNEVRLDMKQNACASIEVTSTQKDGNSSKGIVQTDGKVRKEESGPGTYVMSSSTHTKDGLRLVDYYVQEDVFVGIGETMLSKGSNGDMIMEVTETNDQGDVQKMKMVGTKK